MREIADFTLELYTALNKTKSRRKQFFEAYGLEYDGDAKYQFRKIIFSLTHFAQSTLNPITPAEPAGFVMSITSPQPGKRSRSRADEVYERTELIARSTKVTADII